MKHVKYPKHPKKLNLITGKLEIVPPSRDDVVKVLRDKLKANRAGFALLTGAARTTSIGKGFIIDYRYNARRLKELTGEDVPPIYNDM